MNWRILAGLAGIVAVLGLYILLNPVTVVGLATGIIPWMLTGAGAIYILSIFLRSRLRPVSMIVPALIGSLLLFFGLSMKFGTSVGSGSLAFLFAVLLFGSGAAKLMMAYTLKRSKTLPVVLGAGGLSVAMGLLVLFDWSGVSARLIGILLGLELLGDAALLGALALRDHDGEEVAEARTPASAKA
jgi:uncharacterized membrane protein HdeD (DUF308 family)